MQGFSGKTAIVTGGGSGIGRELCIELAKAGAKVCVAGRRSENTAETASIIARAGGVASSMVADVRDPDAMNRLVASVASEGPLDYMFNNAGVIMFGEFRDMRYEDWRHFIESDLMSVVYGTDLAYKVMRNQGHGHIVNVSSVFGLFPFALATGYAAVKHAVVGLSLSLRPEAAGLGVKISVACPGTIKTGVRATYTIFHGDRDSFNALIWKELDANKAARKILKGVRKNKGVIAYPFYDLFPWWLYRMNPALNYGWQRKLVDVFRRKVRGKSES
jgi:NAD(P)-dependent dehydrogenase (short-subunit alcohol dehydrogenase family)